MYEKRVKMDYEKNIKEFVSLAQEYCKWVESQSNKTEEHIYYLQVILSKLYCSGIQLPDCEPTELFENDTLPKLDYQEVVEHFKGFPIQYYSQIFNPLNVPSEEPVTGDVIDDLSDIYIDLKNGLWYLENESEVDAVFQWRFSLSVHWGRHALGSMYALHSLEE